MWFVLGLLASLTHQALLSSYESPMEIMWCLFWDGGGGGSGGELGSLEEEKESLEVSLEVSESTAIVFMLEFSEFEENKVLHSRANAADFQHSGWPGWERSYRVRALTILRLLDSGSRKSTRLGSQRWAEYRTQPFSEFVIIITGPKVEAFWSRRVADSANKLNWACTEGGVWLIFVVGGEVRL